MMDNDPEQPEGDEGCLACKISKISQCADVVCPEIKEQNPDASCSDAIRECAELACRPKCGGPTGGTGQILILA